jgi:uncharacterized protein
MKLSLLNLLLSDLENPDAVVEELWVFHHWVVAKAGRYGVASIPRATAGDLCCGNTDISSWRGRRAADVILEGAASCETVHRAASIACLNAVVRMAKSAFEGNAMKPFPELVKREPSVFIGHFEEGARWRKAGYPVTIVELEPRPGDVHWNDADVPLRRASLVFLTGLTLLNDTFDQVVTRSPNARMRILMGPTVPPSALLLGRGMHLVGGTKVENPEVLLRYFQYGGTSVKRMPSEAISRFNIVHPDVEKEVAHVA